MPEFPNLIEQAVSRFQVMAETRHFESHVTGPDCALMVWWWLETIKKIEILTIEDIKKINDEAISKSLDNTIREFFTQHPAKDEAVLTKEAFYSYFPVWEISDKLALVFGDVTVKVNFSIPGIEDWGTVEATVPINLLGMYLSGIRHVYYLPPKPAKDRPSYSSNNNTNTESNSQQQPSSGGSEKSRKLQWIKRTEEQKGDRTNTYYLFGYNDPENPDNRKTISGRLSTWGETREAYESLKSLLGEEYVKGLPNGKLVELSEEIVGYYTLSGEGDRKFTKWLRFIKA